MDKLGIESDIEIDRCHIIGPCKTRADQTWDQPCTVVCRLDRFKDKQCILYDAKKTEKNEHQDFLKDTVELRKSLWEQVLEYQKQ